MVLLATLAMEVEVATQVAMEVHPTVAAEVAPQVPMGVDRRVAVRQEEVEVEAAGAAVVAEGLAQDLRLPARLAFPILTQDLRHHPP